VDTTLPFHNNNLVNIIFEFAIVTPLELFYAFKPPDDNMWQVTCKHCHHIIYMPGQFNNITFDACLSCGKNMFNAKRITKVEAYQPVSECKYCGRFSCKECIRIDFCDVAITGQEICSFRPCSLSQSQGCPHSQRLSTCFSCIEMAQIYRKQWIQRNLLS